jgi:polyisoprenyl-phosphate glycosyltransferase
MGTPDLSVVVPCYNEAQNIPALVDALQAAIVAAGLQQQVEIIFVNNGSTDHSRQVFAQELAQHHSTALRLVHVEQNVGYGHGILTGLKHAQGRMLGWTHADLQTDPQDVFRAYAVLKKFTQAGAEVVVKGRRRKRPWRDWAFTCTMSLLSTVVLRQKLFDINAQPKLFCRTFYASWQSPPQDFSLDLYLLYMARRRGLPVEEIDVLFKDRVHGQSRWAYNWRSKYRTILRTVRYIFQLKAHLRGLV